MREILTSLLIQMLYTVCLVVALGVLAWLVNKAFYRAVGADAHKICITTGLIGTPVHECGHALFCLIFGHKIQEIRLYDPNSPDGTLGFVRHSYNTKNFYHKIGNFFIGVGPLILGSVVLLALVYFLLPNVLKNVAQGQAYADFLSQNALSQQGIQHFFALIWDAVKQLFAADSLLDIRFWIFLVLAFPIALHMNLSVPDIKSGAEGFLSLFGVLFIANTILYFASPSTLEGFTSLCVRVGGFVLIFLSFAVVFNLLLLLVALPIKILKR